MLRDIVKRRTEVRSAMPKCLPFRRMNRVISVKSFYVLNHAVALDDRKLILAKRVEKRIEFGEERRKVSRGAAACVNSHYSVEPFLA